MNANYINRVILLIVLFSSNVFSAQSRPDSIKDSAKKKTIFDTSVKKPISKTTHLGGEDHGYNLGISDSKQDEGITYASDINEKDIKGSLKKYRSDNQSSNNYIIIIISISIIVLFILVIRSVFKGDAQQKNK